MQIMCNVIDVLLFDCCYREGVYHDSSWFSRKRLFALQMSYNSCQGLKIAKRQIWLHNSLRSPRPVNEFRTISSSMSSRSSCVFNTLHTRMSEVFLEFPQKNSSRPSVDLCLEMSSNFKYNFCFLVEEIFELGNTTKSRCLGVHVEAQANGKEVSINKRPTSDRQRSDWQRTLSDDEALTDSYSIVSQEDRIVPNTIRKLDTLLTYAHDSNMATAAKQQ